MRTAALIVLLLTPAALAQVREVPPNDAGGAAAVFRDEGGTIRLGEDRLMQFLVETRGLDALLNLMQLELAEEQARRRGVSVGEAEIRAETQRTLDDAFRGNEGVTEADYGQLLDQLLAQQQLSRAEFDVIVRTNANLRAVARDAVREKVDEEVLQRAFRARYGEQARVRVIGVETLPEVQAVRQRLDAGEEFADVAAEANADPELRRTRGELPPFTRQSDYPEPFKEAAFGLAVGGVSEAVQAGDGYAVVKLEELIPPKVVEFADVRDELAEQLAEEQAQRAIPALRRRLAAVLMTDALEVGDPRLAEQLKARIAALQPQETPPDELREQMEQQRPATGPNP